jgi:hypothetical protein
MPALTPTDYTARITWLGRVIEGNSTMRSEPMSEAMARFGGFEGEAHSGITRPSCVRVTSQHPKGTTINNVRQLSVMSAEEIVQIASKMGLSDIDPTLLGVSMIIEGIADFTHVPPSSRLQCEANGTTISIDMLNRPCVLPGREIEMEHEGFVQSSNLLLSECVVLQHRLNARVCCASVTLCGYIFRINGRGPLWVICLATKSRNVESSIHACFIGLVKASYTYDRIIL